MVVQLYHVSHQVVVLDCSYLRKQKQSTRDMLWSVHEWLKWLTPVLPTKKVHMYMVYSLKVDLSINITTQ